MAVRDALADFGVLATAASGGASEQLQAAQRRVDEMFAHVEVAITRVEDEAVGAAVRAWLSQARWHAVSVEEVTTAEERQLWDAMNARFAAALKAATAGRRPGRSG